MEGLAYAVGFGGEPKLRWKKKKKTEKQRT